MSTRPLDQTKNDTDLIFDEHTPLEYIKKGFFVFCEKVTLGDASLEKLLSWGFYAHLLDCLFCINRQITSGQNYFMSIN